MSGRRNEMSEEQRKLENSKTRKTKSYNESQRRRIAARLANREAAKLAARNAIEPLMRVKVDTQMIPMRVQRAALPSLDGICGTTPVQDPSANDQVEKGPVEIPVPKFYIYADSALSGLPKREKRYQGFAADDDFEKKKVVITLDPIQKPDEERWKASWRARGLPQVVKERTLPFKLKIPLEPTEEYAKELKKVRDEYEEERIKALNEYAFPYDLRNHSPVESATEPVLIDNSDLALLADDLVATTTAETVPIEEPATRKRKSYEEPDLSEDESEDEPTNPQPPSSPLDFSVFDRMADFEQIPEVSSSEPVMVSGGGKQVNDEDLLEISCLNDLL